MPLPILNLEGWYNRTPPYRWVQSLRTRTATILPNKKKRCKMLHLFGNRYGAFELRQQVIVRL